MTDDKKPSTDPDQIPSGSGKGTTSGEEDTTSGGAPEQPDES